MIKNIKKFCENHGACSDGYKWAIENCKDMREVWKKAKPEWIIWVATREGVLNDKQLRLFSVWCCRRIWNLITDERSRNSVDVAEKYANGKSTKKELASAWAAAWAADRAASWAADRAAAWAAARAAARAAAWAAARAAAWDAAWAAARAASWAADRAAAWDASWAAARAASWAAAWDAALDEQADYLRKKYHPFGK